MITKGRRIFAIRGIPIEINYSWFLIVALVAWSLASQYFPEQVPGLAPTTYWVLGILSALALFASVLLHELGHSVVAQRNGIAIRGITLHVFGGVAKLAREADSPGVEFRIAVAGPAVSFALALVSDLLLRGPGWPAPAVALLAYLRLVNGLLGAFNLVPGFPLDGGRILRALLWWWKDDLQQATRVTGAIGSGFAYTLMLLGVLSFAGGNPFQGIYYLFIGVFLKQAAEASVQQVAWRQALQGIRVGDVMAPDVVTVGPDLTLARLAEDLFWRHHFTSFPVLDGGQVVGIVALKHLRDYPRERWGEVQVREAMLPFGPDLQAGPGEAVLDAFARLSQNPVGRMAVVERGGRLVGYLSVKDMLHILALRG
ncbi:MAG TPA: site-2 protease family protein [Candidatus Methylomirabilis sp.]|jgi:Zn-dependent protease|nr:site-2 protease family protein [Candidatus Methylomirabilis sp.]